ncbi:glycosyltransferase [Rhodopila sp.]|uniref:glycosyltransferase n=1 Tax=Rhodopila sp. TaxID=2480087 RepID=UPI003D11DA4E
MQATQPFLVYRDRIGVASEIGFLRRQYVGFTRLHPVWIGRTLLADAPAVGDHCVRLGGDGPLGPVRRLMFRHFAHVPTVPAADRAAVLHAQFARGAALGLPLVRRLGLRLIVTLHGGDISKQKNWHATMLVRRWPEVVRETERFVCVSGAVAEVAQRRGVPAAKLIVLPIGVEIPDRLPPRRPSAHLFVGRFVEKKGITVLTAAVRHLRARGDQTPLVCIGDGPLRPLLEALAREVSGVSLTGWLQAEAVAARMSEAIALLVPSIVAKDGDAEGLPSVVAEAMAQGCPVIGSDCGGIAEAIRPECSGLLVPPGDALALAEAMQRIAQDADLRLRLGAAAFSDAAVRLNARIQSAKLEALLLP